MYRAGMAGLHLLIIGMMGTLIVCGGLLIQDGFDPMRAFFTGTPGYVTVTDCHWVEVSRGADGYQCRGVFNGAGLHIEDVDLEFVPREEPVNPVPTVVSGAGATGAWQPGWGLLFPLPAGVVMAGLGSFYLWRWFTS